MNANVENITIVPRLLAVIVVWNMINNVSFIQS